MKKTNTKKIKFTVIAIALVACIGIAGISAYFTDADTTTNTFTVGQISLDLQEPNWVGNKIGDAKDITPNMEIAKDPQVENDGVNAEYVFVTAAIPYAEIKTAESNGTVNEATNTELFTTLNVNGEVGINADWIEIGYLDDDNALSSTIVYREDGTVVHVYAYAADPEDGDAAMTALAAGATTATPVFNTVRFCNAVEDQGLEETSPDIVISAYGIQTTNIADTVGGGNADGATDPVAVWNVVHNANPSTDVDAVENTVTDEKSE